jgi:hypothetical protein
MTPDAALAALEALVEPPGEPVRPATIEWGEFAARNGFEAPADYRVLMEEYGPGGFGTGALPGGWIYTLDPFARKTSLVALSDWDRRNSRGLQRQFPDQFPGWPMWPFEDGLLPWANSADGDLIGWWTVGEPDEWGTRFFGRDIDYEEFSFGAVEFLVRLLTASLGATGLDSRFSSLESVEGLRFYPMQAGSMDDWGQPLEQVTVVFAGLAPIIDVRTLPSTDGFAWRGDPAELQRQTMEYHRRWDAVMEPANAIIESWRVAAMQAGITVASVGRQSAGQGDPVHHVVSASFDPAIEPTARRLVAELAARLGVAIREARNLENERVWDDLSNRP